MKGTRVKQINNIIITKDGSDYFAWTPDGTKCLAQKHYLKEIENLCANCTTFIQNKAKGLSFDEIVFNFRQKLAQCIGSVPSMQSKIANENLIIVRELLSSSLYYDYELHLKFDTKNEIISIATCFKTCNNTRSKLGNAITINKSNAVNDGTIQKIGMTIVNVIKQSLTPSKVYHYASIVGANLSKTLNPKYFSLDNTQGTLSEYGLDDYFEGYYAVFAGHVDDPGRDGYVLCFDIKDNNIICNIYKFEWSEYAERASLSANVDTHNIPRFIQSTGNKLNKLAENRWSD